MHTAAGASIKFKPYMKTKKTGSMRKAEKDAKNTADQMCRKTYVAFY